MVQNTGMKKPEPLTGVNINKGDTTVEDLPKKGTQGGFIDLSLSKYFLKWSWLSSTASSRIFLFLSGIACGTEGSKGPMNDGLSKLTVKMHAKTIKRYFSIAN